MMQRVHPLPTMLTLGNFGCGFAAAILSARALTDMTPVGGVEWLTWASTAVFVAMAFDMLDGKVARMTGSACRFGAEMDSLADVVSFGVAPAVILTVSWITVENDDARWWSMVMGFGFIYAACACLRLARYNVESSVTAKDWFRGLPSPAAAGAVVSAYLLYRDDAVHGFLMGLFEDAGPERAGQVFTKVLGIYMLVIGLLMVTRVRYPHTTNRMLAGRKRFTHFVVALFGIALFMHYPVYVLAVAFNGYVLTGLIGEITAFLKKRRGGAAARDASTTDRPSFSDEASGDDDDHDD